MPKLFSLRHSLLTLPLLAGLAPAIVVGQQAAAPGAAIAAAPTTQLALSPDAADACAQSHLRAAASGTAAQAGAASIGHRRKMALYDVKYYKLDLNLENNSLAVSGTVLMRVKVGAAPLGEFAFELYQAPAGAAAGAATLLIDEVEIGGRAATVRACF